jgi:Mrp family chromosome partitioning ATPase
MGSPDFQKRADALLKQENVDTSAGFAIDAGPRAADSSAGSNIIGVSANSTDAELAAAAANAYAVAFVDMNKEAQKTRIAKSIVIIEEQLTKYRGKAKLTGEYLMLKQRLQDLTLLQATATGNYRVLTPATVPSAPYAPNPMRSALLGFGIGLFAGIGLAFLLEQFDTRIRKPEEVALTLRQPILGRIPRISSKLLDQSSLVTMQQPSGHIAEAFRMVRTNLDFMAVDNDIGSIVVTSCVKSEGKSVATANLAISMALAGKKVVVVDGDLRRPRQHKLFGIDNEKGVSTVVTGRTSLMDAMVPIEVMPVQDDEKKGADSRGADAPDFSAWAHGADASLRLYVLPSGPIPPNPGEIVASKRFAAIIDALEAEADLVIVDSPAMLAVGDTSVIASCVDGLVFLVDMKNVKKPQLMTAAEQLRRLPVKMLGTIVRMYGGRGSRYYYYSPYYYYRYSYTEDGQKTKAKRRRSAAARAADQPISVAAVPVVAAAATALEPVSTAATPPVAPLAQAAPPSVPTAQPLPPADAAAPPAASPPESD